MPRTKKTVDFEKTMLRLETLVSQMEQGDLPLEEALKCFEEGVGLTRECQSILDSAEQKVQILIEKNGQVEAQPFEQSKEV